MEICESEEYLRTIIRSSIDGIAVVDEDGRIEFANESFFKIAGWPREELIGQFFIDVFPRECHEFLKGRWGELECGTGLSYETKIRTKEGGTRFIYISHSQTEIKGRKRYVAIIKDISEKKKLESELKISEAKYRDLFENAVDAIYMNDAEGNILDINKTGIEILGCTKEEIIGTNASRWFTPESWRLTQETMRKRVLGEPAEDPMIRQMVSKSGELIWAEIRSRLIKDGERPVGYQGIGRNINEKVRMQQELKEYQEKLEQSNKELMESEAKYRDLFENAQDIMYVVDNDGNFLEINQAGCQILGSKKRGTDRE
ncbi:MAG: PAS domain S-box protein [Methanosarcinaceae archaeon]|nr:PAS domain S-box protein [Methanosarcinaceae archaeon]